MCYRHPGWTVHEKKMMKEVLSIDIVTPAELKIKSMRHAVYVVLNIVTFLTSHIKIEVANNMSKFWSHAQSIWLKRKLNTAVETSVTDIFANE